MANATAADIEDAIRKRYPSEAYAVIFQVPNGTGAKKTRTADAVVFGLWPSRGLDVEGIEIKVSRSDWRREIADPDKAAQFARYCHRWWIAAAPGIVESGELPPKWGLLELQRGVLRQVVEAPRTDKPEPIGPSMMAGVMRAVQNRELRRVEQTRREIERAAREAAEERVASELSGLKQAIDEFAKATGVDVRLQWNWQRHADAIAAAIKGTDGTSKLSTMVNRVGWLPEQLRQMADDVEKTVEEIRSSGS